MIYYFSGTGNSLRMARRLAETLNESMADMTSKASPLPLPGLSDKTFADEAVIGFVLPVYAWGLPQVAKKFLTKLPQLTKASPYVFAVLTCGDDIGYTDRLLHRALRKRGWPLHAVWSIQMRNTYICLPGFKVDTHEVVEAKERAAVQKITSIIEVIRQRNRKLPTREVVRGNLAWMKTYVLRYLFNTLLTSHRSFRVDKTRCTRCGLCSRLCPTNNIKADAEGRPQWKADCTFCLRCLHGCPAHAIDHGPFSRNKERVTIAN